MKHMPAVLYKYCPPSRLNDILVNKSVRFSQPSACNDPFDVLPSFSVKIDSKLRRRIRQEMYAQSFDLERRKDLPPPGFLTSVRNWFVLLLLKGFVLATLNKEVEGYISLMDMHLKEDQKRLQHVIDSQIGIFCLSERNDSMLMWAHYAAAHTGFAVGFSMSSAFFASPRPHSDSPPQRVSYSTNRPTFTPESTPLEDPMFVKSQEWEYEKEWRAVRRLETADKVIRSAPHPIHLFRLPDDAFHSVIVGCRAEPNLVENCRNLIQSDRGLQHVKIREAFPAKDRFLLEIRERGWRDNVRLHPI